LEKPYGYAFSNYETVETALNIGHIPAEYRKWFLPYCTCGSERITDTTIKHIRCCDPRCFVKTGFQLSKLFSKFGCIGMGDETCKTISEYGHNKLHISSYIDLLNLRWNTWPLGEAKYDEYRSAIEKIKSTKLSISEMINYMAIPMLGDKSQKLFGSFTELGQILDAIKSGGPDRFFSSNGVHDAMVAFYVAEFMPDIFSFSRIMNYQFKQVSDKKFPICISGDIYLETEQGIKAVTKDEYISICNDLTYTKDGTKLFDIVLNKAVQSTSVLVSMPGFMSNQVTAVKKRQDYIISKRITESGSSTPDDLEPRPEEKLLYTPMEFIEYLNACWENNDKEDCVEH